MIARRLDEVLAQTDPFDLAQGAERYVYTLSAEQIHEILSAALPRLTAYYAAEFERVQSIEDTASLRSAFAQALAANLRVIPLFGNAFAAAVLEHVPGDRAVGFTGETSSRAPAKVAAFVVAGALLAAGAAGAHYVMLSRMQAAATALITPAPMQVSAQRPHLRNRKIATGSVPRQMAPLQHPHAPVVASAAAAAPSSAPVAYQPQAHAPAAQTQSQRHVTQSGPLLPPARGEAVVRVPVHRVAKAAAQSQTAALDTSDMPQAYTDATPLPDETPVPVTDVPVTHAATPTPAPAHGWLHRTIMHLNPFKPHP